MGTAMLDKTTRRKAKKARKQARKKAQRAASQAEATLEERARELADRAAELSERVRESDAYLKAQATASQLAAQAKDKIRESELDAKAAELAKRVKESEAAQTAADRAVTFTDAALAKVGEWIAREPIADKLGVRPAKRGMPTWFAMLLGAAAGFAAGFLTASRRQDDFRDDFAIPAQRLGQNTRDAAAPPAEKPLADKIRTRLGEDPRTASLGSLNINVADGTVFVRGARPAEFDEAALREVIGQVEGVTDIDLQLTPSS